MIQGLNHINLAVRDLNKSFDFYKDILGFKPLCRWPEGAYFLAGDLWFCLFKDPKAAPGTGYTHLAGDLWFCLFKDPKAAPGTGYTHLAFSVTVEDFPHMVRRLQEADVRLWKDNRSEGDSLYFLDPDGYQLELHVGDWRSRLAFKKQHPWEEVEFFEI